MAHSLGNKEEDDGYIRAKNDDNSLAALMINNKADRFGDINQKSNTLVRGVSDGERYIQLKKEISALKEIDTSSMDAQVAAAKQKELEAKQREFEGLKTQVNDQLAHRGQDYDKKLDKILKNVKEVGVEAAKEQGNLAEQANGRGYLHMMVGAAQMFNGYAGVKAAELNKKSAEKLAAATATPFNFTPPANNSLPLLPGDTLPGSPTAISPGTQASDSSGAEGDTNTKGDDSLNLGDPTGFRPEDNKLAQAAPPAPAFKNEGGGGSGGGGGGVGGGGSTSPASGSGDDTPPPRMSDSRSPAYEGGGAGYHGGGGSNAGKDGPDLSGLLAQFLPKQGEEAGSKNGILDYGNRRALANDDGGSLLDRHINIFERVHQAYQEKQKKRRVGI